MYIDGKKMMEYIDIKSITKEHITFNVDGEKLVKEIYENIKLNLDDNSIPIRLNFQNEVFIKIYPNEIYDKEHCKHLANQIKNELNSQIKEQLKIKE